MRYIEGSPREIAEYLRLTGGTEAPEGASGSDPESSEGDADIAAPAQTVDDDAWFETERLVYQRSREAAITKRVLQYLRGAVASGNVEVGPGTSERTRDGLTDYVMVRDAGKRRFGAVAYVKATNGGLTLRLTKEDVADLDSSYIRFRDVRPGHQYVVICPLVNDAAVAMALKLTERALAKVR